MKNHQLIQAIFFRKSLTFVFALTILSTVHAQYVIKGKVTDDTGGGLPGATVQVQNSDQGAITDLDGNYSITASEDAVLVFSFIGYIPKEVNVNGRSVIDVDLSLDVKSLDEVVVWGYGTTKRKDLSGAISLVSSEEIEKSNQTNALSAIQGKMAGVRVTTTNGAPGGGVDIRIRGNSTIDAGSQPLYVVDGIQLASDGFSDINPLVDLNPNDIESIQVLKDASATAVYGALGGNGVVLITTKRGLPNKTDISLTARYGLSELYNTVQYETAEQYARRMAENAYLSAISADPSVSYDTASIWSWYVQNEYWNEIEPWEELLFRQAVRKEIHAIMRGGTQDFRYSFSTGYTDEEGIVKNTGLDKLTSRLNLEQKVGKFSAGSNLSYTATEIRGNFNTGTNSIFRRVLEKDPYLQINPEDLPEEARALYEESAANFEDGGDEEERARQNPFAFLTEQDETRMQHNLRGRLYLDYELVENLVLHTEASANYVDRDDQQYYTPEIFQGAETNGYMSRSTRGNFNWAWQARANYSNQFGKHLLDLTGVYEIQEFKSTFWNMQGTNFSDMSRGFDSWLQAGTISIQNQETFVYGTVSGLFRANYVFDNKYNITSSIRNDLNAKFGEDNKSGWFPSVALGWTISNEGFMNGVDWVNNLKLRASTGLTGNSQIPVPAALNVFVDSDLIAIGDSDNGEPIIQQLQINNQSVGWERIQQTNVGIDLGAFDYRLTFTSDYFRTQSRDLLQRVTLPAAIAPSPNAFIYQNIGDVTTEGIEANISYDIFRTQKFNWRLGFNTTLIRSEVNELNDQEFFREFNRSDNVIRLEEGRPLGEWSGFIIDGAINNEAEAINLGLDPNSLGPLDHMNFYDLNGDGFADSNDRSIIANTLPIASGGITNSIRYGNFDLYTFFNYSLGNDLINDNLQWAIRDPERNRVMLQSAINNGWTQNNPNGQYGFTVNHARDLISLEAENGSFLRLQNIEIGWNAGKNLLSSLGLSSMRFSVSSINLWTLTNYSWYDPEVSSNFGGNNNGEINIAPGLDNGVYPRSRNILFTLQLGF